MGLSKKLESIIVMETITAVRVDGPQQNEPAQLPPIDFTDDTTTSPSQNEDPSRARSANLEPSTFAKMTGPVKGVGDGPIVSSIPRNSESPVGEPPQK